MTRDPLSTAEQIASDIAGHPVAIRFVAEPRAQTGLPLRASTVGGLFVYLLSRARAIPAPHGGTLQFKGAPPEWDAGFQTLVQAGIVVPGPPCRGWESWQMPDPQWRQTFEHWDADNQERVSENWEEWAYGGLDQRVIRIRP